VVDGSLPCGPEYEAEMEILRWTGEPSMALINPIGDQDHIEEWRAALQQYFKIVRVFDALTAPFEKRLELLRAFGELREAWREPLASAVNVLEQERGRLYGRVAREIAEMIAETLAYDASVRLPVGDDPSLHETTLEQDYKDALRARERKGRRAVELVYGHRAVQRSEGLVEPLDQDLFSTDHWYFWGLNRRQLIATGAAGGAVVGGVVDAGVGGASMLLGTLLGATIGGATAFFSSGRLTRARVLNLPLGGRVLRCGPTKDVNFPYVVLGRALYHHARVAGRTHANRGALTLSDDEAGPTWADRIPRERRNAIERSFRRLRDGADPAEVTEDLAILLHPIVAEGGAVPGF
jgi:hypothetical protein